MTMTTIVPGCHSVTCIDLQTGVIFGGDEVVFGYRRGRE